MININENIIRNQKFMLEYTIISIIISIVAACCSIRYVSPGHVMIVNFLGRPSRLIKNGLNFTLPLIESIHSVTWTFATEKSSDNKKISYNKYTIKEFHVEEQLYDIPTQKILLHDSTPIFVNTYFTYKITDYFKVVQYSDPTLTLKLYVEKFINESCSTVRFKVDNQCKNNMSKVLKDTIDKNMDRLNSSIGFGMKITSIGIQNVQMTPEIESIISENNISTQQALIKLEAEQTQMKIREMQYDFDKRCLLEKNQIERDRIRGLLETGLTGNNVAHICASSNFSGNVNCHNHFDQV